MPAEFQAQQLIDRFEHINERMRAIETQLAILSDKLDVPYSAPAAEVPPDVVELARAGKTLEAIKLYRELTGAEYDMARDAVMSV